MNFEVTTDMFYQLHSFFKVFIPLMGGMSVMWLLLAVLEVFKEQKWPWVTALFFILAAGISLALEMCLPGGTIYVNIV